MNIDTVGVISPYYLQPVDFIMNDDNTHCSILLSIGPDKYFYSTEIWKFTKKGNLWIKDENQIDFQVGSICYSGAYTKTVAERAYYSNIKLIDINTVYRDVYKQGKIWAEKILINEDFKIIKLEEK